MPQGQVLEFSGATKRFGGVTAVSDFTARVEPGVVTGFLGPNGAGKTTSLRMLLGLVRPTAGSATIDGVRYAKLKHPLQTVGAVLESSSFHPGRTGAGHLAVYAQAARIPKARVDEVLGLVGLADAAGRKVGGYSLGMRQRLGLAYALLGDPGVLVLDEPTNGLDPEGIKWIRGFLRQLAREGRTVFVSSHLLSEVQQTVDALLIIAAGRLVFQGGLEELSDPAEQATVVDSADRPALAAALKAAGIPFEVLRSGLTVRGIEPVSVGLAAAAAGVPLSALHKRGPALEEVFLDLVNGTRVHASASGRGFDDVIPAIESGAIPAGETVAEVPDAAPPAAAEEPAPPEAIHEDLAVIDDDASAARAPGGEAPAEAEEDRGEPVAGAAEPGAGAASFAVASTGVIDVVAVGFEEDEDDREDEEDEEVEGLDEDEEDDELEDDELDAEPVDADDRPWEEYVKTDADLEADRFFAAFDAHGETAASEDAYGDAADEAGAEPGEGKPEPDHDAEGEEPAHDHGRDEHDGGEHR